MRQKSKHVFVLFFIIIWFGGFSAPFLSQKLFIPNEYCDICSVDNPYCSCNSDEMDPDCPVMQEKSQGLLLIFPAAPLERNSGKTIQKQILYQSIQFGHAEIGSGNNSEYYSGIPVNAPPIKQITELYKIVETFLI